MQTQFPALIETAGTPDTPGPRGQPPIPGQPRTVPLNLGMPDPRNTVNVAWTAYYHPLASCYVLAGQVRTPLAAP